MKIPYLILKVHGESSIDDSLLEDVEKKVTSENQKTLYFLLESDGGSPFSAVRIMTLLQKHFSTIHCVIPDRAMSAATLMALGANDIYMADKAVLGPLDLPIEHPKDGSRISALDVQNTITTIATLSNSIAEERYSFLRKDRKMSKSDAARLAFETATEFTRPVMDQVDPYHLQKSYRELKIGLYLAFDLLCERMMKDDPQQAVTTARNLVNNYPAHEYCITPNEAIQQLKLPIKKLEDLNIWSVLKEKYGKVKRGTTYHTSYGVIDIPDKKPVPAKTKNGNVKNK